MAPLYSSRPTSRRRPQADQLHRDLHPTRQCHAAQSAGSSCPQTPRRYHEICPTDPEEHLGIGTSDATAHALVIDALARKGPADPQAIDARVCAAPYMPGLDPATYATDATESVNFLLNSIATYPKVDAEPPLRCYVTASCKGKKK